MKPNRKPYKEIRTSQQLEEIINDIETLDLKTISIEEVKNLLEPLSIGMVLTCIALKQKSDIYRASKFDTNIKPKNIKRLSYRDKEDVNYLQRCNDKKSTIFYGSFFPLTAVREVKPELNNYVAISRWETKIDLIASNVGFETDAHKSKTDWVNDAYSPKLGLKSKELTINKRINKYFSNLFYEIIDEDNIDRYKLTIAVSRLRGLDALSTNPVSMKDLSQGSFKGTFDGLIYPSIVDDGRQDNIAIRPFSVDTKLKFLCVEWCKVISVEELNDHDYSVTYEELDYANSLDKNGNIEWKGRKGIVSTRFLGDVIELKCVAKNIWQHSYGNGDKLIKL